MPSLCHQCGAESPDGVVFCRQCGAPQIRVTQPASTLNSREDSAAETPAAPSDSSWRPAKSDAPSGIDRSLARSRGLLGALLIVALMLVPPLALFFPLWMVLGGVLTVYLYFRRDSGAVISLGEGARMGLMAGLLAFLILTLLSGSSLAYEFFVQQKGDQVFAPLREQLQHTIAANPDPQVGQVMQRFLTPDGMALLILVGWLLFFLLFLLLGSMGGMLGAWMFGRRSKD